MKTLTNNQKKFAEKNHGLVGSFLKSKHLPFNEYYDIVIFGYLNAVKKHTERSGLKQYRFKNIAFRAMESSLGNHFRSLNSKKNKAVVFSLDAETASGLTLEEMIASAEYTDQTVVFMEERNELLHCFDIEDRKILSLMMDGFCENEIAENTGLSPKIIPLRAEEIRTKARQFMSLKTA